MNALFTSALLVEDELSLVMALEIALKKLKIPSHSASTLQTARQLFHQFHPDFLLLDRCLPDGEGLDLCYELRTQGYSGSILMLTASDRLEDRILGLNQGADDYLAKPFSWEELEARIRALARRRAPFQLPTSLWALNPSQLQIQGPRGLVTLTPLEFKLASHLMLHAGKIISRDELLKEVWGFTLLPKTRTVDFFLSRLRKHFELNPEEPQHFLTIRGAGYKFQR